MFPYSTLLMIALFVFTGVALSEPSPKPGNSRTLRLEAQTIEGKIKRPQAALLSIEKRPTFKPMALTRIDLKKDVLKDVDPDLFENKIYSKPFMPEDHP